jgi:replicative DNA helicase
MSDWMQHCLDADGKIDAERAWKFWGEVLHSEPSHEERLRLRDRRMSSLALDLMERNALDAFSATGAASLIMTRAWFIAAQMDQPGTRQATILHVREVMQAVMEAAERPAKVIPTSFPTLDEMLCGGPQPGELIYLGARPGVGKTAFALEIARSAATCGNAVLIVSREMMAVALGRRMIAQAGKIPAKDIRRARASAWPAIVRVAGKLSELPIWITDNARSVPDVHGLCEQEMPRHPDLVIVDYLQLLDSPGTTGERRHQVEAVSKQLKTLAMQRQVPVICISSLSRPGHTDSGKEKAPTLASLRESGQLEHDADVVLFLHRQRGERECECIIEKNRDGESGVAELYFTPEFVSFAEASQCTEESFGFDRRSERAEEWEG